MDSCNVWADVDFGHGPVEIRCTEKGQHNTHRCVVQLPEIQHASYNPPSNVVNIFERNVDDYPGA